MFIIRQEKDESFKNYHAQFNTEALPINGCSNDLAMSAMMVGLKPGKLLWSIGKNDFKDFQELLSRAQKYANAKELMNSR